MKNRMKTFLGLCVGLLFLFGSMAFVMKDSRPDIEKRSVGLNYEIALEDIETNNTDKGCLKSSVLLNQRPGRHSGSEFYGQLLMIEDNPEVDRIYVGITTDLISRIEIWKGAKLKEVKEMGFVGKMTWGEAKRLEINLRDQRDQRSHGKSSLSMRFCSGTGFWGDIGTLKMDLTPYGDLSGPKTIGVFAKSLNSSKFSTPEFTDLRIWRNYRSFD